MDSTTAVKSKKVSSLTVLENFETQGTAVMNAIETSKDNERYKGTATGFGVPNNALTAVQTTQAFNPGGNVAAPGTTYVAPVTGVYSATLKVVFTANATGWRKATVFVIGDQWREFTQDTLSIGGGGSEATNVCVSATFIMTAGEQLRWSAMQNSGVNPLTCNAHIDVVLIRRTG